MTVIKCFNKKCEYNKDTTWSNYLNNNCIRYSNVNMCLLFIKEEKNE